MALNQKRVGQILKEAREKKLTVKEVAKDTNISVKYNSIRNGRL